MIQVVKSTLVLIFLSILANNAIAQVSFCAVGDILLDRGVRIEIENNGVNYPFEKIRNIISRNDLSFFNLECPLADSSDGFPVNKRFSFRAEPSYINGLKYAGFNIASVANNHTIDYGKTGFMKTIELLNQSSLYSVGGGENQQQAFHPLLLEKEGETFAFFAVLEFLLEGTTFDENKPYPAFGQIEQLCKLIEEYNTLIDNIVVSFHWGIENSNIPTSLQTEYAHKVIDAGADLVLGHHPHVLQSIETYRNKLILYSLGNFVFDNSEEIQKQSALFQCKFKNGTVIMPELLPVYIKNNRPEPASTKVSKEIYERLKKLSETTDMNFNGKSIQINYKTKKAIKELINGNDKFDIFENQISVYNKNNNSYSIHKLDENYKFKDACIYEEDRITYIYAIIFDIKTKKSCIAIFPFSLEKFEFLKPSIDSKRELNPWKIEIMDVDDDNNPEIILGVKKQTKYFKKEENRIFVFNREKDYIFPKWLGSKIGNPIIDFKIDKKLNQLIVLEKSLSSSRAKAISYKWNGFGFDNDEILFEIENLKDLKCQFMLSEYQFKSIK